MPFLSMPPPSNMPPGAEIFARAESVWVSQALPPYIAFTTYSAAISDAPVRVTVRTSDGKAFVEAFPDNAKLPPVGYPGVNLRGPGFAPLGYCVNMNHCSGVLSADPFAIAPSRTGPPELRTIARVHAFQTAYAVTSARALNFDGSTVYDLQLAPLRSPEVYRLRELVVDAQTYHVWKMFYEEPDKPNSLLTYGFGPVENIWYMRQTCDAVPIRFSKLNVPACTPDVAMMWNYEFPASVPDWYFDPSKFAAHLRAQAPPASKP